MSGLLVLVFAGQCGQAYVQPAYQPYQQTYVEKTIFVAVEDPTTYYSGLVATQQRQVERQAQAQQTQATTDQKIDELTRIIQELQRRLDAQPQRPLLPDKPAVAPAVPNLSPLSDEAVAAPPTVARASSRVPGLALLSSKCAGCHSGSAARGGGHRLFAVNGQFSVGDRETLETIEAEIASGRMPKAAKQLSLREYIAIRDFLNEQSGSLALESNLRKKLR